jgi:hypothetical protein
LEEDIRVEEEGQEDNSKVQEVDKEHIHLLLVEVEDQAVLDFKCELYIFINLIILKLMNIGYFDLNLIYYHSILASDDWNFPHMVVAGQVVLQ